MGDGRLHYGDDVTGRIRPLGDVTGDNISANTPNGSACDGALSPSTDGSSPLLGPSVAFSVTF